MNHVKKTKTERMETRLDALYDEWDMVRDAIRRILMGEPVSYQIGSRNITRRPLSLNDLKTMKKEIESEIDELENQIDGTNTRRKQQGVIFRDW